MYIKVIRERGMTNYGKFVSLVFSVLFMWRHSVVICCTDYKYDSAKVGFVYVKALGWTLRTEVD
jgi:hypothetical protein